MNQFDQRKSVTNYLNKTQQGFKGKAADFPCMWIKSEVSHN